MKESSDNSKKKPRKKPGPRSWKQIKTRKSHKPPQFFGPPDMRIDVETGRVDILPPIIRRAHELAAKGYRLYQVAEMLSEEFGIKPPSEASISRWFKEAQQAFLADIKGFRAQRTFQILSESVALRERFLPLALDDQAKATRYMKIDGMTVPYIDENAFPEQAKAAEVVVKLQAVEMELLGLKGGAGVSEKEGGDQSITDLFAYMGKLAAARVENAKDGNLSPMAPVVLELRSGVEHIYNQDTQ